MNLNLCWYYVKSLYNYSQPNRNKMKRVEFSQTVYAVLYRAELSRTEPSQPTTEPNRCYYKWQGLRLLTLSLWIARIDVTRQLRVVSGVVKFIYVRLFANACIADSIVSANKNMQPQRTFKFKSCARDPVNSKAC